MTRVLANDDGSLDEQLAPPTSSVEKRSSSVHIKESRSQARAGSLAEEGKQELERCSTFSVNVAVLSFAIPS